jgi:hypothetical protein
LKIEREKFSKAKKEVKFAEKNIEAVLNALLTVSNL